MAVSVFCLPLMKTNDGLLENVEFCQASVVVAETIVGSLLVRRGGESAEMRR